MSSTRLLAPRYALDKSFEVGIDEAGRGPMFGRVYAAAVVLPEGEGSFDPSYMKDSKKFSSQRKINEARDHIKEKAVAWAVEWCDEKTIDKENIRNATFIAMHKCVKSILSQLNRPCFDDVRLLVDGDGFKSYIEFDCATNKHFCVPHVCIKHGDNSYCSIAAASILAKTTRDDYIEELCASCPELDTIYSLRNNKGYGTKAHIQAIKEHGITPWHRRSYGICQESHFNLQIPVEPSQPALQQSPKSS